MNLSGQWMPDLAPLLWTPFKLSATPVHSSFPAHTIFWLLTFDIPLRSQNLITLAGLDAEENMVL
jgi:hypothetical protein